VGPVRSNDINSYAGSGVATGRTSQTGQVKSDVPDKERHPCPADWGFDIGLRSQLFKKNKLVEKTTQIHNWTDAEKRKWIYKLQYGMYKTMLQPNGQRPSGMEEDCIGSQGP
jgi:hypothetical protein